MMQAWQRSLWIWVGESVNKFNSLTLGELAKAVDILKHTDDLKGVIFASAKDVVRRWRRYHRIYVMVQTG